MTLLCIFPPYSGWGWHRTKPSPAESPLHRSPSNCRSPDVNTIRSSVLVGDMDKGKGQGNGHKQTEALILNNRPLLGDRDAKLLDLVVDHSSTNPEYLGSIFLDPVTLFERLQDEFSLAFPQNGCLRGDLTS